MIHTFKVRILQDNVGDGEEVNQSNNICFTRYQDYFCSNLINVLLLNKKVKPHSSTLAWKIPWMEEPGGLQFMGSLSAFTFTFHFPALEKEMATHSSVLAWRIPGTGEPGGLPSVGSHRVGHD